jgi:filamentous hemagglutinin family protein
MLINIILIIMVLTSPVHALNTDANGNQHPHGITASGLNTSIELNENAYMIQGGTQKGNNLFHSFETFNLHTGEIAYFDDAGMQNTIGRITGADYSWINGKIISGAANLYLINPNGIMFGADVSLNIAGSFHATTADYLKFGENDTFFSQPFEGDVLSMSAPTAFGFLDRTVAPILIEGKGELPQYESPETGLNLSLPQTELKTVSLVGGDIKMEKGTFYLGQYLDAFGNLATGPIHIPLISSHSGNINLVSVKSPGEVVFTEDGLNLSGFDIMGTIDITDKVAIDVSGYYGGGNIRIFSDYLNIEESSIHSRSWGFIDGRSVDIRVNHFNFSNGSVMNCDVEGSGNGSDIHIHAESISLVGTETPFSPSYFKLWNASVPTEGEPGNVGSIIMNADTIHFDIAIIQSTVSGRGDAAMINLNARDSIVLKNSWISSVSRA